MAVISLSAQTVSIDPFGAAATAFGINGNYLGAVERLNTLRDSCKTKMEQSFYLQAALTYNSFIVHNAANDSLHIQWYKKPAASLDVLMHGAEAFDFILEKAKNEQVVMFNEQHFHPKHRRLVAGLLPRFYDLGYRYLAIEAIYEPADSLMKRRYPLQETGIYTREPQMANLIRTAIDLGFTIIRYDTSSTTREFDQAANLYRQTLEKDSTVKLLVLAGIGHILESEEAKMMAYYFKKMSSVNPYTINQVGYESYAQQSNTCQPCIVVGASDNCDLFLVNAMPENNYYTIKNLAGGAIENQTIALSAKAIKYLTTEQRLLLSVYDFAEFKQHALQAVPLLNYLIEDNQLQVDLLFTKGRYSITIRNNLGDCIDTVEKKVD